MGLRAGARGRRARRAWSGSATAIRWPSASCGPPTRTRRPCSSTATTTCRASAIRTPGNRRRSSPRSAASASTRAAPPTTRATSCRCCTRPARWRPPGSCRSTCASSSRAKRRPAARASSSGCAPTSAAPTARSSSTPAWRTCTPPRSHSGCAASSPPRSPSPRSRATCTPGMYGGVTLNAAHVLHGILGAVLPGPDGVLREELREGIVPPSPAELESWAALRPSHEALDEIGARPVVPGAGDAWRARTGADASLDVNMLETGAERTIVPARARAYLTLRLAPRQDAARMRDVLDELLRAAAAGGCRARGELRPGRADARRRRVAGGPAGARGDRAGDGDVVRARALRRLDSGGRRRWPPAAGR